MGIFSNFLLVNSKLPKYVQMFKVIVGVTFKNQV
jgi:hypothetical protein